MGKSIYYKIRKPLSSACLEFNKTENEEKLKLDEY